MFVSVRQQNAAVRAQEGGASRADGGRGGEAEDAGQGAGEEEMEARRRRARARVADMMRERDLGAYGRRRGVRVHMAVPARLDGGGGESGARIKHLVHPYLPLVVVSALQPGHAARAAVVTRSDCQGMLF